MHLDVVAEGHTSFSPSVLSGSLDEMRQNLASLMVLCILLSLPTVAPQLALSNGVTSPLQS